MVLKKCTLYVFSFALIFGLAPALIVAQDAPAEEDSSQSEVDRDQPKIVLAPDEVSGALALTSSVWKSDSLKQP